MAALTSAAEDAVAAGGMVVSPSSVLVALSMLADGATGASLTRIDEVLGSAGQDRRDAVSALRASLGRAEGDPATAHAEDLPSSPVVHQACQLVVDQKWTPQPEFVSRLAGIYGADSLVADLSSTQGLAPLHSWVDEHSGGLVQKSAITPDPGAILVFQDAITLAAAWRHPFRAVAGALAPFVLGSGAVVDVPAMTVLNTFAYAEHAGWCAVRLPYRAGPERGLHTDVFLPPQGTDVCRPSAAALTHLVSALDAAGPTSVQLTMAKVSLTATVDLEDTLRAVGLGHLWEPATAGLTGILVENEPISLAQAVQQSVLRLDERGTRAAAVTELLVGRTGAAVPVVADVEVVVDRPFVLAVTDSVTGWPLFLAGVTDPRAARSAKGRAGGGGR